MNAHRSILLAVLLLVEPAVGTAQQGKARVRSQAEVDRAAAIAALPRGEGFTSGGQAYRLLGGARAVRRAPHESEAEALGRAGASPSDVIHRKGKQYLIVRSPGAAAATVPKNGYLTAVNRRTGHVAVVSGLLEVRTRKGVEPAELARAHGLGVVSSAPRLAITFLRVPAGSDLPQIAAGLGRDPVVESVEIEVIERLATPR